MYKKLHFLKFIMVLALVALTLVGCSSEKGTAVEENVDVDANIGVEIPQIDESDIEEEVKEYAHENVLTGLDNLTDAAVGKRPVAVMVNNIPAALPQYGISSADIIFEIPVEGNQTRLMAIYGDYTQVPKVCAVRSCRDYFPAFAKGFDAFYVHWGQDNSIMSYLEGLNMERFNGLENTGKLFGRDTARRNQGYALEHTGYFDGTGLVSATDSLGMRVDLLDEKKGTAFQFCEIDTVVEPSGEACNEVYINYGAQNATLVYDAEKNVYLKKHNGSNHVDGVTGEQLAFTNIVILETSIYTRDSKGHKFVDWEGSADAVGYYISNGKVQQITWSKANEGAYLKLFDANGEELILNRGKMYIGVCTSGQASIN